MIDQSRDRLVDLQFVLAFESRAFIKQGLAVEQVQRRIFAARIHRIAVSRGQPNAHGHLPAVLLAVKVLDAKISHHRRFAGLLSKAKAANCKLCGNSDI